MFSQVISKTAALYKKTFLYLIGIEFLTSINLNLFTAFLAGEEIINLHAISSGIVGIIATILLVVIVAFAFAYIQIISTIASVLIINAKDRGKSINLKQVLRTSHRFIGPVFCIYLFSGAIIFTGSLFLLIPGLILFVWFILDIHVLIFENEKGIHVLIKSRDYIKGNTLKVGGMLALLGIIITITQLVSEYIFKQINFDFGYTILNLLLLPVYILFTYSLYCYFRANKLPRAKSPRYSRPLGSTSLFTASLHPWTESPRFLRSLNKQPQVGEISNKRINKYRFIVALSIILLLVVASATLILTII